MLNTRELLIALIYSTCYFVIQSEASCEPSPWTQWVLCLDNDQEYRVRETQKNDACTSTPCNHTSAEYREYQCSILKTPNVDQDTRAVRSELMSLDPNITMVAEKLAKGSASDRLRMSKYYKAAYGSDLLSDLSASFVDVVDDNCWSSLIGGTTDHVATSLIHLIQLVNSDHVSALLITNDNEEIERIQLQYKRDTGESLDDAISQRFSGDESRVLRSLASGQRDEYSAIGTADVEGDAYDLRQATLISDAHEILRILGAKDKTHLNEVFNQYKSTYGRWVQYHIRRKITGSVQASLLNIVDYISDDEKFCAVKIFFALGLATGTTLDEQAVERTLVDCAKVSLCKTVLKYQEIYNRDLADDITNIYHGPCAPLLVPLATLQ
ncbi:annexin A4-like [Anneissia japonica]|uniref:annexin A4-like n=1 Tax=Anneissia japonica TaxID=1529436 RepID=UPI0014258A50|nr:annexin A4-like [Anneissia japonica]